MFEFELSVKLRKICERYWMELFVFDINYVLQQRRIQPVAENVRIFLAKHREAATIIYILFYVKYSVVRSNIYFTAHLTESIIRTGL